MEKRKILLLPRLFNPDPSGGEPIASPYTDAHPLHSKWKVIFIQHGLSGISSETADITGI
jgi:hypothetical protein